MDLKLKPSPLFRAVHPTSVNLLAKREEDDFKRENERKWQKKNWPKGGTATCSS